MRLYEHQGKELFAKFGIPVPRGRIAATPEDAERVSREVGGGAVLKAQLLVGGRGKAGLIRRVNSPEEARKVAAELLQKCPKLLVEELAQIQRELYVALLVDRDAKEEVLLASAAGGVEVEAAGKKVMRRGLDPHLGLREFHARALAKRLGLGGDAAAQFPKVLGALHRLFRELDGELAEINPLAVTPKGLVALDARVILDDNAAFRHPDIAAIAPADVLSPLEMRAKEQGLQYVELDGEIGVVGNGAGLVMATLDLVDHFGGRPANFCDLGGGTGADVTARAIDLVVSHQKVKVLFVNIMAGITRCDDVAKGILTVRDRIKVPAVVRMVGTNQAEGRKILEGAGITALDSMDEAAKRAVEMWKPALGAR
ncbi:MAG: ADP-forming succinate--CoA ligase subunit beta, partial [Halobacteria archaeon]